MQQQKIKKVNVPYTLAVILIPIIIGIGLTVLSFTVLDNETVSIVMWSVGLLGISLWFALGAQIIFDIKKKKRLQELETTGFICNHTFNADSCTVVVDKVYGKIGLIFKWNCSKFYVLPANRITNIWVDDGKMLGGTRRVSFLFIVDGIKIRVNTFISSRQTYSMKSNCVLEAISKADMMVEDIKQAYAVAQQIYGNVQQF